MTFLKVFLVLTLLGFLLTMASVRLRISYYKELGLKISYLCFTFTIFPQKKKPPKKKEQAKKDMSSMLEYIDKLNELDTTEAKPMSHVFSAHNVFREDVVTNTDMRDEILQNAPQTKDGQFKVPVTI